MLFDLTNFLHSFARFAAAGVTDVVINYASGSPRNLWRNKAPEDVPGTIVSALKNGDPYSVMRIFGGPGSVKHPKPETSIQIKTFGTNDDAAWMQANALYEAMALDASGMPLRMELIDGYRAQDDQSDDRWMLVNVDTIQRPGLLGRDDRGRAEIVFNLNIGFYKVSG